jgi:vancomycin resistance protein YoaR
MSGGMATEDFDSWDQVFSGNAASSGARPGDDSPADVAAATTSAPDPATTPVQDPEPVAVSRVARPRLQLSLPGRRVRRIDGGVAAEIARPRHHSRVKTAFGLLLTFGIGALACLAVFVAVVLGVANAYSNTAAPGVHIGSLEASGLTRAELVARIQSDYSYVGQGTITVTTPTGKVTLSFADAGRVADAEFMADEAMAIGHSGNPLNDAVNIGRTALNPHNIPLQVRIDPNQLALKLRALLKDTRVTPANAAVTNLGGIFSVSPATIGGTIDETAIEKAIVDRLAEPDAKASFEVGAALITVQPSVTDAGAQAAIAEAERMAVDTTLTWDPVAGAQASAGASPSSLAAKASAGNSPNKTFPVPADTIRKWIVFGWRTDGSYGPTLDTGQIEVYVAQFASQVATKPVEPKVVWDKSGKPIDLTGGRNGSTIDVPGTAQALAAHLSGLGAGGSSGSDVNILAAPNQPTITLDSLKGITVIGQWSTEFWPGISNGNGANIWVPAGLLSGQIVPARGHFNFLSAVGPIDRAHGYTMGGVIKNGKSDHTGAMGGGICSASTTVFNAAMRAGLQIDERHAHQYYIDRYPVGLDATVFSNGYTTYNMRWTNDTDYPIVIRSWSTHTRKSLMTVQIWSQPTGRHVSLSPAFKDDVVKASDKKVFVKGLAPGVTARAEYPSDGYKTSRTRTVTDADGKVIHTDTWNSKYVKVDGIVQVGAPLSTPTPTPTPVMPAGADWEPATIPSNPTPTSGTRRRIAA